MTPLLVFLSFLFGAVFVNSKKTERNVLSFKVESEGLKEVFPDLDSNRKICKYYFSGDLESPLVCDNEFECRDCPIHKRFVNSLVFTEEKFFCTKKVMGLDFSPCIFYHRGHTLLSITKNGNVLVGIDSFILNLIGKKAEKVVLPEEGDFIEANEIGFSLIIEKDYFPILSPVSGEIVKVNDNIAQDIKDNKAFVWLCMVKPFNLEEDLPSLLLGREAEEWFKYEVNSFKNNLFRDSEFAADGGELAISNLNTIPEDFVENFLYSYKRRG
ncbi:conserved hypothetical protein [Thermotomaculum hydrothermale]|uniref:Glycine cleavage H-protein n=1 Tax=Thermotomaculum hydrothermale TaxID=981385 RepID=A0A7R6SXX3_9BACT|nr:hypothetical protein [Thermotomaculum hydrothermale]BBB32020.1 conserved hypothetical protein [Thermotomaculum hydrothermale]